MQLGDVIDLGSSFKNLKCQRLKLIILAFEKIFGLKQADIDPVLFKLVENLHQNNGWDDDDGLSLVCGLEGLMGSVIDYLFAHHKFYKGLSVGHKTIHFQTPAQRVSRFAV